MSQEKGTDNKIERLVKGDSDRTAMHADVMNEIIDRINAWQSATVSPQNTGHFLFSDANVVLDLTGNLLPPSPGSGTFVLGSIDNVVQWIPTTDCSDTALTMD